MARLVVPGYPHHITQRGNRRQQTFFNDGDYGAYLSLTRKRKVAAGVDVWAYCLMPNHVHLVVVPTRADSLANLLRVVHHRYARRVNKAHGWRGHLWQERFQSFVMDETHLLAAVRYVELNPVRAGLCGRAQDWPWSSVRAHEERTSDDIVNVQPMLARVPNWRTYLDADIRAQTLETLRDHAGSGRPAGSDAFLSDLERATGRRLKKRKPGRPKK